ncbi:MAG: HEAT repeat domain-containing protein [Spirochaetes bacterium]|nr:HEAT repeat domain-containing protein [Spirochaetota bacterium]
MERDILQSIKLELTKNLKFTPYLRICLHPFIANSKIEVAHNILCAELSAEPIIRFSAIRTITQYLLPGFTDLFHTLFQQPITDEEKVQICKYLATYGNKQTVELFTNYIMQNYNKESNYSVVQQCMETLRILMVPDNNLLTTLKDILNDTATSEIIRYYAIRLLSIYNDIHLLSALTQDNDYTLSAIFDAVSYISHYCITQKTQKNGTSTTESEDNLIIEARVFLSKMLSQFDEFSSMVKIACLNALIVSKHRETNDYVLKVLNGKSENEKEELLFLLQHKIMLLRDPEPLIRALISFGTISSHHNAIIVDIILNYFTSLQSDRTSALLKDKLFNYFTVTLDSFFELYRKNYMISNVEEKNYPEAVRKVRDFILSKFTPQILHKIIHYLRHEQIQEIQKIIALITTHLPYVDSSTREPFSLLIEMLYDSDPKSREISASRLETIDFEKRFLQERIVRLCNIIAQLNIQSAATLLVKIYNYLKKYRDEILFESCIQTLSRMRYPYMLGELELMLLSGDRKEQLFSLKYFSNYKDQQAASILFELLKSTPPPNPEVTLEALNLLAHAETTQYKNSTEILRSIIETNNDVAIKQSAILTLGHCGNEKELEWLITLFADTNEILVKETILQAIGSIVPRLRDFNKRALTQFLLDCMKESGIRIRIYACALLLQLNNKDVERYIKEMLIIKNRDIQIEMLYIFHNYAMPEFSYFLLSLLKEEYAIGHQIISLLLNLPAETCDDIVNFIANMYRKNGIDISQTTPQITVKPGKLDAVKDLFIISIKMLAYENPVLLEELATSLANFQSLILDHCKKNNCITYSLLPGSVIVYSNNPLNIADAFIAIKHTITQHNSSAAMPFKAIIQSYNARTIHAGQDILLVADEKYTDDILYNYAIIDENLYNAIHQEFTCTHLPHIFANPPHTALYYISNKINSIIEAQQTLDQIMLNETTKKEKERELLDEIKKRKLHLQSQGSAEYLATLEKLNGILHNEINEINKLIQKRSTDRELNTQVARMLENLKKKIFLEISNFIMK